MILISIIILFSYFFIFLLLLFGVNKIKEYKNEDVNDQITFSIIIPFRNEAHNLPDLLESLSKLNYDKLLFEVILVNDESSDSFEHVIASYQELEKFNLHLINNYRKSKSPKKDAIDTAILKAKNEWIITTDADCIVPLNWLKTLNNFIQFHTPNMIVMPVSYMNGGSMIESFQILELLSLQSATVGGFGINHPFLCNGANLAYQKNSFKAVEGFSGNENIASGDDIFLLEKMLHEYPSKIKYLKSKEVVIETKMVKDLVNLFHQRIRWASKSRSYNNPYAKIIGATVLAMNLWLVVLIPLLILDYISWVLLLFSVIAKMVIDLSLVYPSSMFFQQKINFKIFLLGTLVYPFYNLIIAFASFGTKFEWKGRSHSK